MGSRRVGAGVVVVTAGPGSGGRLAGGLLAQFLPQAPERMRVADLPGGDGDDGMPVEEDDLWLEARTLVETIDADELTDPHVSTERLLFRLFHERGVRVYPPEAVFDRCSCSREKLQSVLMGFSQEEKEHIAEDGSISVTCEFCSTTYKFSADEV